MRVLRKQAGNSLSDAISATASRDLPCGLHFALHLSRRRDVMNELVGRIRSEFLEMPGLRLTVTQASRLWGLDEGSCKRVIDVLIGMSFLRWTTTGTVARTDD